MFWKAILITTLAIGALADLQFIIKDHNNMLKLFFTEICTKNGAADKVDEVVAAILKYNDCLNDIMKSFYDATLYVTLSEIEEAKFKDGLNETVKKVCDKAPRIKTCIHNMRSDVAPCMDNYTRSMSGASDNTTDQLIDYLCEKDGERIVLFFTQGGPRCYKEKSKSISECTTKTTADEDRELTEKEQCDEFDELTACIVKHLKECPSPTTGNMAESLFRIVSRNMCIKD